MNYTYYRRYQPSRKKNTGSFRSFFWFVLILVGLLLLLRACMSMVNSVLEEKKDEAVLTVYKGTAQVLEWGQSEAEPASDAQLVLAGDQVETDASSWAILTFYNGTTLHLDQNTTVLLSEITTDAEAEQAQIKLISGRAWVAHSLDDDGGLDMELDTDFLTLQSLEGEYLVSHVGEGEGIFVHDGPVTVQYMDRRTEDTVIETVVMKANEMSLLDPDKETKLLAREDLNLVEPVTEGMFTDTFVQWCEGGVIDSTSTEDTSDAPTVDEPTVDQSSTTGPTTTEPVDTPEESPSPLSIQVLSPSSGSTIPKDAIAIEGSIVSGTASRVTVTWSGNGQPYTLTSFQAGDSSFRYVADVDYGNYAHGQNTYTITAYDADGNASNTVTVVLQAEF